MTFATTFKEVLSPSLFKLASVCSLVLLLGAPRANAGITFTCDPSIDTVKAGTCTYLNSTIAGYYNSTFANANANIYITYGNTGLGQSLTPFNFMSYNDYVAALSRNPSPSPVQVAALAALKANDAGPYGSGDVMVRGALQAALGVTSGLFGITAAGDDCTRGTSGCYDSIVTLTNDPGITWYYLNLGGTEPDGAYDFYTTVLHEADEVLGTGSCIGTATSMNPALKSGRDIRVIRPRVAGTTNHAAATSALSDRCGSGIPSAADLYRYLDKKLVLDSELSTKSGAYFSYDGGATKGALGVSGAEKLYNTAANGDDYADFVSSTPDCATNEAVQDAEGCPGEDAGLNLFNDGRGEINIINALGFNLVPTSPATVTVDPTFVDIEKDKIGKDKTQDLKLTNASSSTVTIGAISIAATYGDSSQFSFDNACDALDAGKDCKVTVHFSAKTVGITRAMMTILTTPGTTLQIPLTGTGE